MRVVLRCAVAASFDVRALRRTGRAGLGRSSWRRKRQRREHGRLPSASRAQERRAARRFWHVTHWLGFAAAGDQKYTLKLSRRLCVMVYQV